MLFLQASWKYRNSTEAQLPGMYHQACCQKARQAACMLHERGFAPAQGLLCLETFQVRFDGALSNLIKLKMSLHIAAGASTR